MQAIRQLADDFKARYQRLDVLINNAGALMLSRQVTIDGIEMTFALNHLSYFLLTNLLLDVLKSSSPSRIVNVSSDAHQNNVLDFEDLQLQNRYRGYKAYGQSKLANLLFTYELARRLEGTNVTVNGLHPGLVATAFLATNNGLRGRVYNFFVRRMGRSVEKGARTVTYLAASSDVEGVSGGYFMDEGIVSSSRASYDKRHLPPALASKRGVDRTGNRRRRRIVAISFDREVGPVDNLDILVSLAISLKSAR